MTIDTKIDWNNQDKELTVERSENLDHLIKSRTHLQTRISLLSPYINISRLPFANTTHYLIDEGDFWQIPIQTAHSKPQSPLWNILNLFALGMAGTLPGILTANELATIVGGGIGAATGYIIPGLPELKEYARTKWFEAKYSLRKQPLAKHRKESLFLFNTTLQTEGKVPIHNGFLIYLGTIETYERVFSARHARRATSQIEAPLRNMKEAAARNSISMPENDYLQIISLSETYSLTTPAKKCRLEILRQRSQTEEEVRELLISKIFNTRTRLRSTINIKLKELMQGKTYPHGLPVLAVQVQHSQKSIKNYLIRSGEKGHYLSTLE